MGLLGPQMKTSSKTSHFRVFQKEDPLGEVLES